MRLVNVTIIQTAGAIITEKHDCVMLIMVTGETATKVVASTEVLGFMAS